MQACAAPFLALRPLILASGSPRRREMLAALGLSFTLRTALDEPPPDPGEEPAEYARRAALAKARQAMGAARAGDAVLAADTVVALEGDILGKPADAADALRALERLAGREHLVITGCAVLAHGEERVFAVETRVRMADAPAQALAAYAATAEPLDKAGSYAIQGAGGFLVESIRGSASNVVGLPLAEVTAALLELGIIAPRCAPDSSGFAR